MAQLGFEPKSSTFPNLFFPITVTHKANPKLSQAFPRPNPRIIKYYIFLAKSSHHPSMLHIYPSCPSLLFLSLPRTQHRLILSCVFQGLGHTYKKTLTDTYCGQPRENPLASSRLGKQQKPGNVII